MVLHLHPLSIVDLLYVSVVTILSIIHLVSLCDFKVKTVWFTTPILKYIAFADCTYIYFYELLINGRPPYFSNQ